VTRQPHTPEKSPLRGWILTTAITLFLSIVLGGIMRTLEGGGGMCPDWPTCFGGWLPPLGNAGAMVDYAHRLTSALAGVFSLLSLIQSLSARHRRTSPVLPLVLTNLTLGMQFGLGRWIHFHHPLAWGPALHLGLALAALGSTLWALLATLHPIRSPRSSWSLSAPLQRRGITALVLILLTLLTGAMVTATGAGATCAGWPLCSGTDLPLSSLQWLALSHRAIVLLTGAFLTLHLIRTWQTHRHQPAVLTTAAAAGVLFLSQGLMGAVIVGRDVPWPHLALHQASATAMWAAMVVHVPLSSSPQEKSGSTGEPHITTGRDTKQWLLDLLALTKPIVVALLLVTTFAGMVIGAGSWPSLKLTAWVLLGGFMAAGGSGAINQYIDRQDDQRMQRTRDRPIPSGRLTPGEGLALGVGLSIASFYVMAAFVNMIAALLTLAGIVYYVLIYSIFLKKTTVQNIVIGGGAGAIPPLVGWAAATGGLNIPSLFLFAVVFMWTPPHFWALAIVRRKDYARADIPMLPVAEGLQKTRRQIFIYTVELVILTLLLPLFGLGGSVYLIFAVALGGWILTAAWKVLKREGNRFAWRMYRYSSMYLAFLFAALMIDALI